MIKKTKLLSGMSLLIVMIMLCTITSFADFGGDTAANDYADWVNNAWANLYGNQPFEPDKNLTRGEMCALINSLYSFNDQKENSFTDVVDTSIYYNEVSKAYAAGYVLGRGNNVFDPDGEIIIAEAYIMIARVLKLDMNQQPDAMLIFKDASEVPVWAEGAVEALAQKSWINDKSKVKPFDKLTGAAAVALLEKVSDSKDASAEANTSEDQAKGDGQNPLNFLGAYFAAIEDNVSTELCKLEDGNSSKDIIIKLVFDRGVVRDYWENNKKQIKLVDNKGNTIESEVFRIDGADAEKSNIYIKPLVELKSGKTVNIVIGKDLTANNGNTLGEDMRLTFIVR